jgi:RHS repeat-associated protein
LNQSYAYDNRNRVSSITGNGKTTMFSYDTAGRLIAQTLPNGTTVTNAFDNANQLLSRVHVGQASLLASFEYTYDLSGNRTNMTTLEGANSYAYDPRNWLTSATYPDGRTQTFTYDPVGNRTRLDDSGIGVSSVLYSYDAANRLQTDVTGTMTNSYTYDNAGRLTGQTVNGQSRSYAYSFRSQMTSLTDTNGVVFTYAFDGAGDRISQSQAGCLSSRYVYDGPNVVLDLNASNQVVYAYVHGLGIDQPIERIDFINGEPRTRLVYQTDGLGSVVAMTDSGQQTAKSYSYEVFGRIRSETGNALIINRYTYTAREALGDSLGLYYYRWRVMDPSVGRFTSEDPLGFDDGINLYVYAQNSGINKLDPWGLSAEDLIDLIGQIGQAALQQSVLNSGLNACQAQEPQSSLGCYCCVISYCWKPQPGYTYNIYQFKSAIVIKKKCSEAQQMSFIGSACPSSWWYPASVFIPW